MALAWVICVCVLPTSANQRPHTQPCAQQLERSRFVDEAPQPAGVPYIVGEVPDSEAGAVDEEDDDYRRIWNLPRPEGAIVRTPAATPGKKRGARSAATSQAMSEQAMSCASASNAPDAGRCATHQPIPAVHPPAGLPCSCASGCVPVADGSYASGTAGGFGSPAASDLGSLGGSGGSGSGGDSVADGGGSISITSSSVAAAGGRGLKGSDLGVGVSDALACSAGAAACRHRGTAGAGPAFAAAHVAETGRPADLAEAVPRPAGLLPSVAGEATTVTESLQAPCPPSPQQPTSPLAAATPPSSSVGGTAVGPQHPTTQEFVARSCRPSGSTAPPAVKAPPTGNSSSPAVGGRSARPVVSLLPSLLLLLASLLRDSFTISRQVVSGLFQAHHPRLTYLHICVFRCASTRCCLWITDC